MLIGREDGSPVWPPSDPMKPRAAVIDPLIAHEWERRLDELERSRGEWL